MSSLSATALLRENAEGARRLLEDIAPLGGALEQAAQVVLDALLGGGKLLCCGNGGSAADSAHLCAEIAGRFVLERRGYAAVDLTSGHALLTALANDYPPAEVFARRVAALGCAGDVLVVLTTSGQSENIVQALQAARAGGLKTVAFLGRDGGRCKGLADVQLIVPSDVTARIQEMHVLLYHTLCQAIDGPLASAAAAADGGKGG